MNFGKRHTHLIPLRMICLPYCMIHFHCHPESAHISMFFKNQVCMLIGLRDVCFIGKSNCSGMPFVIK